MSGMEGLRRGAQNVNNGKGGKGGKGRGFYSRWKPPYMAEDMKKFLAAPPNEEARMGVSEPIILLKGEYKDLYARDENGNPVNPPPVTEGYHFKSHTFNVMVPPKSAGQRGYNQFRDVTCSSGPEAHAPQPCCGCHANDNGMDGRPRDQWAFEAVHLGWYHQSPLVKDNQVQMKRDGGGPVLVKNECDTQRKLNQIYGRAHQSDPNKYKAPYVCEGCQGQHPWAWGDHRTLQLGKNHLLNLLDVNDKIGQKCATCGTNILRVAFDCGNAQCGQELIDVATTGWTNQQLDQYAKQPIGCQRCGYVGLPVPAFSCGFNENFQQVAPECANPKQTALWDCVLWIQREGESTSSEIVITRIDPIATFQTPDNRPLTDHIRELVKDRYDLAEMFKPDSLEEQAKRLFIQNPYAAPQQTYQSYPGQQQPPQFGGQQPGGFQPPQQPQQPQYPSQGYGQPPQQQGGYQQQQQPQPTYPNMGGPPGRPNYNK